jgi:hypothetical protein
MIGLSKSYELLDDADPFLAKIGMTRGKPVLPEHAGAGRIYRISLEDVKNTPTAIAGQIMWWAMGR